MTARLIIGLFVALVVVGLGFLVAYSDIPATEEQCQHLDGTNDYIARWCDCETVWPGGVLNKSHTECHAKNITAVLN